MSDPYRTAPTSDPYALYLHVYIATLTGGTVPSAESTREEQAIALAIEDAMSYRASCEGHDGPGRAGADGKWDNIGRRERWELLKEIEDGERAEPPPEEEE